MERLSIEQNGGQTRSPDIKKYELIASKRNVKRD